METELIPLFFIVLLIIFCACMMWRDIIRRQR
jgi:hypothetical protein